LAKDVLVTVKETDLLIDDLPGLERTEEYVVQRVICSRIGFFVLRGAYAHTASVAIGNKWKSFVVSSSKARKKPRRSAKSQTKLVSLA
jgi:hypothetical protein